MSGDFPRPRASNAVLAVAVALGAACVTPGPQAPARVSESPAPLPTSPSPTPTSATPAALAPAHESRPAPVLVLHTAADLDPWREALAFGDMVFGVPDGSTKQLRKSAAYRGFVADLQPRAFPKWWLGHPHTHFVLVGIVNRLDRRDMRPGTCGETRLLYRLEHRGEEDRRRLPASLNVIFEQPDDGKGCADVAESWFVDEGAHARLADPGRPLSPERLSTTHLLAVEVNLREDDPDRSGTVNRLSVHAYDRSDGSLSRSDFEFELHGVLWKGRGWQRLAAALTDPEMLEAVRVGTPAMTSHYPAQWDATFSTSTRQGSFLLDVLHNARSTQTDFGPFADAPTASHRMETLTCSGCHRQRSVGGFHLPGDGGPSDLVGGVSAHLLSELPFRRAYVEAVAAGQTPDQSRKHPHAGPPGIGASCSVATSPVDDLTCAPGHDCVSVIDADFGTCLPEDYDGAGPCDRADDPACQPASGWFLGGFVSRPCDDAHPCAPVATPDDVRACGGEADLWTCVAGRAEPRIVDACEDQAGCREGWTCAAATSGQGVCLPTDAVAELHTLGHAGVVR